MLRLKIYTLFTTKHSFAFKIKNEVKHVFGYIRVAKPELKVREYEVYKAVYCSLCRKLGKSYGPISRLTLSYDFTFLALLQMSMQDGCDGFEKKHCAFNPFKKCNYCKNDSAMEMPAAAAMILLYYKILDNTHDERGFKRIGYMMLKPIFSRAHKKAAQNFPHIESLAEGYIKEQNELEAADCTELDRAADPTAKLMSEILPLCSEDAAQKRVLARLGYCIGRYIYLLDAACDLEDDIKSGSYNVLKVDCTENPGEQAANRVRPRLYFCVNEAVKAFELLNIKKYRDIIGNIIYLGLEDTFIKSFKQ